MTEPDTTPTPEHDPEDDTGAGERPPVTSAEPPDTASAAESGAESGDTWDLPETDRAYVMASLTRLSGDHAELGARLRVAEDRIEDLAVGFDGIEDAATTAATGAGGALPVGPDPGTGPGDDRADSDHAAEAATGAADEAADEPAHDGIDMVELVAWVRDHVALLLERKLPQSGTAPHWCRQWWMHAEAIARFEALRRGWVEAVAGDGNAMVVWFEHLDLMLSVLMGEGGTFSGCVGGEHRAGAVKTLGHHEPDASYFAEFDLLDTG